MKKQSPDEELVSMVHLSNAKAHDFHAQMHDRNVPYIHRKSTRAYYWKLLKDACNSHGRDFNGATVLEIGCGTGTFTDLVLSNGVSNFCGIDVSPKMIDVARSKTNDKRALYEVSALEFFADKHKSEFDIIFSVSFIHHLADVEYGLNLIKQMLKTNGVYVGLHELKNHRQLTFVERIDHDLQYLFGYSGSIHIPIHVRIKNLFKNIIISLSLRFVMIKWFLNKYMKLKKYIRYRLQMSNKKVGSYDLDKSSINYVDYQLNEEFSLTQKAGHLGEVIPYSYFGFIELLKVSKPLNHEMLIITNDVK